MGLLSAQMLDMSDKEGNKLPHYAAMGLNSLKTIDIIFPATEKDVDTPNKGKRRLRRVSPPSGTADDLMK